MDFVFKDRYGVEDLVEIVGILRGEGGCPWDREQTHETIRQDFIEEVYEAIEAIDLKDPALLREELGDVLLQVVFHSRIEEEEGRFVFGDVVNDICQKMIIRHPHVFGSVSVNGTDEVLTNWEAIKNQVKGTKTQSERLYAVPRVYPALMRAQKVEKRAVKAGFSPAETAASPQACATAMEQFLSAASGCTTEAEGEEKDRLEALMGNLLFSLMGMANTLGLSGEFALTAAVDRFIRDFERAEKALAAEGKTFSQVDPETLQKLLEEQK